MKSLRARNVTRYVIVFLIIKSFDIFGSFGVADFAFLICFYTFKSNALQYCVTP